MNDKDFYGELDLRNVLMTVITPLSKDRRKIEVAIMLLCGDHRFLITRIFMRHSTFIISLNTNTT